MGTGGQSKVEYRYYEIPPGSEALFLSKEEIYREEADVMHFHNVMEIGYCYQGEGTLTLKDGEIPFTEGTFSIIPGKIPHMTESDDKSLSYWKYLFVDADRLLASLYGDDSSTAKLLCEKIGRGPWIFTEDGERENAELILQMIHVMEERGPFYQEEFKGLTMTLLVRMANRKGAAKEEKYEEPVQPSRNSTIISRAVDYISKVPERPVKIEELAKMCHISETHFRRVFGECMKMTPVEYINRVRIRRACEALEKTNSSVSDIAAGTGFGTVSTFNRNFRQITGVSPQQWRKNAREQD